MQAAGPAGPKIVLCLFVFEFTICVVWTAKIKWQAVVMTATAANWKRTKILGKCAESALLAYRSGTAAVTAVCNIYTNLQLTALDSESLMKKTTTHLYVIMYVCDNDMYAIML